MDYYRKQYASSDLKAQEQRKSNPPRQQKQAYEKKAPQVTPVAKTAVQKSEPVKKPGFFERLFGLRKKK